MKNIFQSLVAVAFGIASVVASGPAAAQGSVRVDIPMPGLEIRVGHRAPPKMRSENRPPSPGRAYVWAPGQWDWHGSDWAWVPGRWDRPSEHGAHWVKARYVQEGPAWRHEPGHWSNQRIVEGDDYRRWKSENQSHDKHGGHDDGRNH